MKKSSSNHAVMKNHLDTLRKIEALLQYEPEKAWPEARSLLREVHRFFSASKFHAGLDEEITIISNLKPKLSPEEQELIDQIAIENYGVKGLVDNWCTLTAPWLQQNKVLSKADVCRFSSIASELCIHLERRIKILDERISIYLEKESAA